ncbi:YaiI/YqxD family protein [Vibrio metschnikovii]|uniref:YaiI/YqxD family protein n=1 Tax=Vibrio metschnikovii TaxID=28172 RepID=UPI001C2F6F1F|nr:YaiI/YqxD family protein [Vibrio metschnikovii]
MKIWVDADACPKVIRETLIRAAERTGVECTFVANHQIPLPKRSNIIALQVPAGFDVADNEIVKRVEKGDLVITSDIPLADEVITKGALALSSRGELFTTETIKARLNIRDFLDTMRSSGIQTGGPNALSQTERREFANHLDRWLTRRR